MESMVKANIEEGNGGGSNCGEIYGSGSNSGGIDGGGSYGGSIFWNCLFEDILYVSKWTISFQIVQI